MARKSVHHQPSLFDEEPPLVKPCLARRAELAGLVEALRARASGGPFAYLTLGLHEADPLLPALKSFRAVWYTTELFLVCWQDGEAFRARLDDRPPYLELGSL